jgi:AraC-like DNA-binding protein
VRAEEVPDVLGVSPDHFHRHIKAHVPVIRCGAVRLYRVADLDRWAEENAAPILGGER